MDILMRPVLMCAWFFTVCLNNYKTNPTEFETLQKKYVHIQTKMYHKN